MKNDIHVIHVVPNEMGGGAERLVSDLHARLKSQGLSCERVHFCGIPLEGPPVTRFGYKHDALINIQHLRRLLKRRLRGGTQRIILHSHLTHSLYACLIASRGLPIRWVHTEHNTKMRLREIPWMRPVERKIYERCDKIVAISEGVRNALETVLQLKLEKIVMIHNGANDFGLTKRGCVRNKVLRIVSVGSLLDKKGFDIALRALSKASIGPWHYTIVGEGSELSNLQELANRLGLSERVTFAGWADPAPHYRKADLQLIPSRWEGFGLVAVEGMSTGLRLLASDVAGLREVIGSNRESAYLVEKHLDPESWVARLETIVANLRQSTTTTSSHAAKQAKLFTIEQMITRHVQLYEEL
jgi:glycosyltransferase involved in cell wall biosynthesis